VEAPKSKVSSSVEDVEKHFRSVWDPRVTPDGSCVQPKEDSPWYPPPPMEKTLNLEGDFAEWMCKEEEIKACLKSMHNLSAMGTFI
jgi:hypothetical protein